MQTSNPFQGQIEMLDSQTLQSNLDSIPEAFCGGGKRARTDDPLLAKQVLYQLSYTPAGDQWWA